MITASLQIPSNTKYLDLKPDLKSFLDDLEKTIHLNGQKADQPLLQLAIESCVSQASNLEASANLIQNQFELDQRLISAAQQASSQQFLVSEYTSHSVAKLKAGENLHPLQTKLIDEYFVKSVQLLGEKIEELNERMQKILQLCYASKNSSTLDSVSTIERIIKEQNEAILYLAARVSQLRSK